VKWKQRRGRRRGDKAALASRDASASGDSASSSGGAQREKKKAGDYLHRTGRRITVAIARRVIKSLLSVMKITESSSTSTASLCGGVFFAPVLL